MAKFVQKAGKGLPAISTASLPDIVFMLLFFFMVTTQMRESTLMLTHKLPSATAIKKLEKKSLVSTIHIGPPTRPLQAKFGTAARIQLNEQFATIEDIKAFISSEREQMDEVDRAQMTVSLKIDQNTRMGLVGDVKMALRKSNALKINYSTQKKAIKVPGRF
jgi:biopolymer transport protein ExbD